jgi:hypothetical protein
MTSTVTVSLTGCAHATSGWPLTTHHDLIETTPRSATHLPITESRRFLSRSYFTPALSGFSDGLDNEPAREVKRGALSGLQGFGTEVDSICRSYQRFSARPLYYDATGRLSPVLVIRDDVLPLTCAS